MYKLLDAIKCIYINDRLIVDLVPHRYIKILNALSIRIFSILNCSNIHIIYIKYTI